MSVRDITAGELIKLRAGGQYSEVFVIPRVPNVIYSARLAAVPTSHDMVASIAITDGVGDIADVRVDMKMLVGSVAGADDLGFCRVRALPDVDIYGDGVVYTGELSHIDWQASCYITIVDDYDIFPRPIRIVSGEAFIDYGVEYHHQHEDFDPIVNMGGHRVLFIDPDTGIASHTRNCTNEGSTVFDGTITNYLWESPNASAVIGEDTDEAEFQYEFTGHFVEYCTLTTDGGVSFTGVRYVFIVDRATLESNIHLLKIDESVGDGVSISFSMTEHANLTDFRYRAFVIAFSIDYYGGVEETISYRQYEGNVLGSGRIAEEQIEFNDEAGEVTFSTGDFKHWMRKIAAFPFGLERATNTPADWTSMPGLNVDRAVWELLHRYCTISRIADIHLSGDTRYAEELASTSSNLLSQLEEITLTTIYADLVFDVFGIGWLRVEPQLVPTSERFGAVIQEITSDDWQDGLSIELNTYDEMSQMNSSGVSVPQFGSAAARISLSYGHIFSPFGDPSTAGNLLLGGQDQSNSIAGLIMGWNNRRFDGITIEFIGNNRMYSLAEYCRASFSILANQNPRGIAYDGFIVPQSISKKWDAGSGLINTAINFQDASVEQLSIIGDFPEDTGINEDFSGFPPASIKIPPLPPMTLPPTEENLSLPAVILIWSDNFGVMYTVNANDPDPTKIVWLSMNSGLTTLQSHEINNVIITPNGTLYLLTQNALVFVASSLGGLWTELYSSTEYPLDGPGYICGIGVNPLEDDQIAIFGGNLWRISPLDYGMSYLALANIGGVGDLNNAISIHGYYSTVLFNNGGWTVYCSGIGGLLGGTPRSAQLLFESDGVTISAVDVPGGEGPMGASDQYGHSLGTSNRTLQWAGQLAYAYGFFDFTDATPTNVTSLYPKRRQAMSFSPTGNFGMGCDGGLFTAKWTSDGGATWLTTTLPVGSSVWENCKDDNRWLFGGGMNIQVSLDRGGTVGANLIGNLVYAAPLINIVGIRFIE